jgi:hypothetical protein
LTTDTPIENEESIEELEQRIALLEQARINLRVSPVLFDRLDKQATFKGLTIEDHCAQVLEESVNTLIGRPTINAPSKFNGKAATERKITGPTYQVSRG